MKTKFDVVQPEGNYYDKYHSSNPIVKWMMANFKKNIKELLEILEKEPTKICETGCEEGEITTYIKQCMPKAHIDAFDISENVILNATEQHDNIDFFVGNIYTMEVIEPKQRKKHILNTNEYDLVVCSEVLEHLEEPENALKKINEITADKGYILLSVPNEPIWRICNMARGKYLKQLGNTPGHIQHWSKRAFCKMLTKNNMRIIGTKTPFPWTMVLITKR